VIAAYNAGPVPVERWAYYDRGDPLLWIESIPYWETRFYVPSVLRNMWVIQGLKGETDADVDRTCPSTSGPTFRPSGVKPRNRPKPESVLVSFSLFG
jgi:hypothetical protein